MFSRESIHARMRELGHVVFDGAKPFDLNIVGLRRQPAIPNTFCDRIAVFYRETVGGPWVFHAWPATTNPGTYWLQNPMNVSGTGILIPGQYRGSHSIGMHRGAYRALVQTGTLRLWLDADKDAEIDHGRMIEGTRFGINIHHAGEHSTRVDKWSAGCQVFANLADYNEFMGIVDRAFAIWGPRFSYSLVELPADEFPGS